MKSLTLTCNFVIAASLLFVRPAFADNDLTSKTLAEAMGAYIASIVMAQEIKNTYCGKNLNIAARWRDLDAAKREVVASFAPEHRAEVALSFDYYERYEVPKIRRRFQEVFGDPQLSQKCSGVNQLFWTNFDRGIREWERAKKLWTR